MKISSLHRAGLVTASAILAASLAACAAPRSDYPSGGYQQGAYSSPERGMEYGRVTNVYQLQAPVRSLAPWSVACWGTRSAEEVDARSPQPLA